jgi:hypothetical protein
MELGVGAAGKLLILVDADVECDAELVGFVTVELIVEVLAALAECKELDSRSTEVKTRVTGLLRPILVRQTCYRTPDNSPTQV